MRKDDFPTAKYPRIEPPSPLRAKYYHGNKVIIIADASDRQLDALIAALCGPDANGITQ